MQRLIVKATRYGGSVYAANIMAARHYDYTTMGKEYKVDDINYPFWFPSLPNAVERQYYNVAHVVLPHGGNGCIVCSVNTEDVVASALDHLAIYQTPLRIGGVFFHTFTPIFNCTNFAAICCMPYREFTRHWTAITNIPFLTCEEHEECLKIIAEQTVS